MTAKPRIGFVGIGAMGWPMAKRVLEAGFALTVFDVDFVRADRFSTEVGGKRSASLAELGRMSDVVVTMLPNSEIVGQVLFDPNGVSEGLAKGSTVVEMSSGVPSETVKLGARLAQCGVAMIDAPVSGGVRKAVTGELAIMAGGNEQTIAACTPVLKVMGTKIFATGALGTGQAMKALNNLVLAAGFVAGIEALLIGKRFGLDPANMVEILNASSGKNNSTENRFAQFVLSRSFDAGFSLELMVKDLSTALRMSKETNTPAMLSALTRELWAAAALYADRGADHTAVTLLLEKLAGTKL